ncbi:MAG TPA: hypothetical protein VGN64_01185 [Dyadobacter sp.]|jgi:hypothetical protein|nr:hypothetical protein [Dyadobacter sp.]
MAAIIDLLVPARQIRISACLLLYGSEASHDVGAQIIEEINSMYNAPMAKMTVANNEIQVVFDISYELINTSQVADIATTNQDYRYNFIRIESQNHITRSFMGFGLGDNSGHWLTSDQLGTSTTAAHEFGHCLGLDHPVNPDFRGSSTPPPIMAARGSLVDAQYQWNPLAKAGEYGGTMNPKYRKVTTDEIALILEGLNFEETETYYLGYLSNNLFDQGGRVV